MDLALFERKSEFEWRIKPFGNMRVPGVIFADEALMRDMDDKVYEQVTNVATLPGIVEASYAMPDAHWGYGFPIGGVAAFDADAGRRGLGRRRRLRHLLRRAQPAHRPAHRRHRRGAEAQLADALFTRSRRAWAAPARSGWMPRRWTRCCAAARAGRWSAATARAADLERIEERGCMRGADPAQVSEQAKKRQRDEMGTLGSGNHYLEVQEVDRRSTTPQIAAAFGLQAGRHRGQHPLRLARARPPDRHRLPEAAW